MNHPQRFVVVGLGSIGQRHARNLRQLRPGARIVALRRAGGDPSAAHDCDEVVCSIEEAVALRPAAAVIAGPATTHVETALRFLDAGVPVLVEKPLSHSLADARRLLNFAAERNAPAMLAYNLRFDPSVAKLRELIVSGAGGRALLARAYVGQYLPDWRPGSDYRASVSARAEAGGGALLELSHEIDLACWLFGMPKHVFCASGRYSDLAIDVEDIAELVLEYDDPAMVMTIGLNFLDRTARRSLAVMGTDATILWDGLARRVELGCDGGAREHFDYATHDRNESYLAELAQFLSCVEDGASPAIPLDAGQSVLAVIEAARQSILSGCRIELRDQL